MITIPKTSDTNGISFLKSDMLNEESLWESEK